MGRSILPRNLATWVTSSLTLGRSRAAVRGERGVDGLELGCDEFGEVFGGIGGSRGSGLVSQCRGIGHIAPL